ncbi:hypothetical protein G7Y89_g12352 [Cudoniella acicularis]|uniref:Uncharacterized protein n=1 Tax=Cudoniella acicularis TaxID=354080 RepID=A0A8H4VX15_9HELO|nr:hypothetical protein G7Y89_g12352 [Cudoniella acicularis]
MNLFTENAGEEVRSLFADRQNSRKPSVSNITKLPHPMAPHWLYDILRKPTQIKTHLGVIDPNRVFSKLIGLWKGKHGHLPKIELYGIFPSSNIVLHAHSPDEIARAITDFVSTEKCSGKLRLNRTQRRGISEYRELRIESNNFRNPGNPEDSKLMEKYYLAFNKIFFLAALKNLCTIEYHGRDPDFLGECRGNLCSAAKAIPSNSTCLIILFGHDISGESDNQELLLKLYLGGLLMQYRLSESCWQRAAFAIESVTKKSRLGRVHSLACDYDEMDKMPEDNSVDWAG